MQRSFAAFLICAGVGAMGLTPTAKGDDVAPPWYRGHQLSTYSEWEFNTSPGSFYDIYADVFNFVPGSPSEPLFSNFPAKAEVDQGANWMWVPGDGDGGLTPAPGAAGATIGFKIPNFVDLQPEKLLRIQITYQLATPIITHVEGWFGFGGNVGPIDGFADGGMILSGPIHEYQDWIILPNPSWELIVISVPQGCVLDEVVVDTVSLPTPGAIALLALGGMCATVRRRR